VLLLLMMMSKLDIVMPALVHASMHLTHGYRLAQEAS
jgi:hypothetical protein